MDSRLEKISCDLCGGGETSPVWSAPDRMAGTGEIFSLVKCAACGLVFVNPRPPSEAIMSYYLSDYSAYLPSAGVQLLFRKFAAEREAKLIKKLGGAKPKILEIGSGSGEDLFLLKSALGFEVLGTEASESAVSVAKRLFGLNLLKGDITTLSLPSVSFDYIRIKYVISHVPSPKILLSEACRLLRPGGHLAMWVPNFNSWSRRLFGSFWQGGEPPRHLFNLTPQTLKRYLDEAGFETIYVRGSAIPNTWIHSARVALQSFGALKFIAGFLTINPVAIFLFFPFSLIALIFGGSDRLKVLARRKKAI